MRRYVVLSLSLAVSLLACTVTGSPGPSPQASPAAPDVSAPSDDAGVVTGSRHRMRLVALGDGYTAATHTEAPQRDSWPAQLVHIINRSQMPVQFIGYNLAANSNTSADVLAYQLPQVASYQPDVVTLQVGVNDILSEEGPDTYRANLGAILDGLLEILPPERIFAVTTPDHELTPKGRALGPVGADSTDVAEVNRILAEVAAERDIAVVDIEAVYSMVTDDPGLVVGGGPEPSARQYAGWAEIIGHRMLEALSGP